MRCRAGERFRVVAGVLGSERAGEGGGSGIGASQEIMGVTGRWLGMLSSQKRSTAEAKPYNPGIGALATPSSSLPCHRRNPDTAAPSFAPSLPTTAMCDRSLKPAAHLLVLSTIISLLASSPSSTSVPYATALHPHSHLWDDRSRLLFLAVGINITTTNTIIATNNNSITTTDSITIIITINGTSIITRSMNLQP